MRLIPVVFIPLCIIYSCTNQSRESITEIPEIVPVESPTGFNASLPYLISNDNNLFLSWMEHQGDSAIFKLATMTAADWSKSEQITHGVDLFSNWADYPMIGVTPSGGILANYMVVTSEEKFSNDINLVSKSDTGQWSNPVVPHTDRSLVQHGFVSLIPLEGDKFNLAWLDGRNGGPETSEHYGSMTLRAVIASLDNTVTEEVELDDYVCSCCQITGTMTENGPVVLYRDRSPEEIRDISIVRQLNGDWTAPKTLYSDNWKIAGCPVNGPRADAIGNNLAVAWFTAPDNKPEVKVIFSKDGGENFGDPVIIDNKYPIGRVDLVMLDHERAMISWLCKEGNQTLIKAQVVHVSGKLEPPLIIAESDAARGSGFPQMAHYKGEIYFAWTRLMDEDQSEVKMAKITL